MRPSVESRKAKDSFTLSSLLKARKIAFDKHNRAVEPLSFWKYPKTQIENILIMMIYVRIHKKRLSKQTN